MEIGSEYWKYNENLEKNNAEFWNLGKDNKFTLSGRTSIYYILKNIIKNINLKKAYLPSYCCESISLPFIDLGIEVVYYDVYFDNGLKYNINLNQECDIFFAINYFGYSCMNMEDYIKQFKKKGKIVIEDITHSIFSNKKYSEYSDYLFASLRKWFPIASGGIAVNMNSNFLLNLENTNKDMISIKTEAMKNKENYMSNSEGKKEVFLKQYSESEKILDSDYKNYSIDEDSLKIIMGINIEEIINRRKENIKIIYEKLKNNKYIKFMEEKYDEKDCLLFVPIILDTKLRDKLRKYLIENKVYLPIHWILNKKLNNIFDHELSLVCDQRYTNEQINIYIDKMINFLKKV